MDIPHKNNIKTTKETNRLLHLKTKNIFYHSYKHELKNPTNLHNNLTGPHIVTTVKNTYLLIFKNTIIYCTKSKIILNSQIKIGGVKIKHNTQIITLPNSNKLGLLVSQKTKKNKKIKNIYYQTKYNIIVYRSKRLICLDLMICIT